MSVTELEMLSVSQNNFFVVYNNLQRAAVCLRFWEVYNTNECGNSKDLRSFMVLFSTKG